MSTLELRHQGLLKARTLAGLVTDAELARCMGITYVQLHRVLTGVSAPGGRFVAGMTAVFGTDRFADLFIVIPDRRSDENPTDTLPRL